MIRKQLKKNERQSEVDQNKDGTFSLEWDKNDPNWKFLMVRQVRKFRKL